MQKGYQKSRFLTNISLYFGNVTKCGHSYNGRWLGNRMRSVEWCQFQWPWTTSNPDFKSTSLFDIEYLRNGTRWRHAYQKTRPIRLTWHNFTSTQYLLTTQRCKFEWPWVTLSDRKILNNTELRAASLRQLSFLLN